MIASVLAFSVLPEAILHTRWFAVLSGFVAVNTILYVSLSIFRIMPKVYLSDYFEQLGRRAETRSIYPNGFCPPDDYNSVPGSIAANGPMLRSTQLEPSTIDDHPRATASSPPQT